MNQNEALRLVDRITGQFQMLRQYLNDEAQRAYFDVFFPYDYTLVKAVVDETLLSEDQPPTAGWFHRRLRSVTSLPAPVSEAVKRGPETPEETERRRNAMREVLCDERGKPKNDFAAYVMKLWENAG